MSGKIGYINLLDSIEKELGGPGSFDRVRECLVSVEGSFCEDCRLLSVPPHRFKEMAERTLYNVYDSNNPRLRYMILRGNGFVMTYDGNWWDVIRTTEGHTIDSLLDENPNKCGGYDFDESAYHRMSITYNEAVSSLKEIAVRNGIDRFRILEGQDRPDEPLKDCIKVGYCTSLYRLMDGKYLPPIEREHWKGFRDDIVKRYGVNCIVYDMDEDKYCLYESDEILVGQTDECESRNIYDRTDRKG